MGRLKRFEEFRFVGTRDTMLVYDCDDADQLKRLQRRVDKEDLVGRNQLQAFASDTLAEAANRSFNPANRRFIYRRGARVMRKTR